MASNLEDQVASASDANTSSSEKPKPLSQTHTPNTSSPTTSPKRRTITFKQIKTPEIPLLEITLPQNFPPIEEHPDSLIPLHWNYSGDGSDPDLVVHHSGRPYSTTHDNLDYEYKINAIIWDKDIKRECNITDWLLYSALDRDDGANRRIYGPGSDDEVNPVFWGFHIADETKDNWAVVDEKFRSILKEAFGPTCPPIRYLEGEEEPEGLFD